jgi:predicted transcriptional regulator/transcriptional regulator with XRE-family HTH domain
MGAASRKIYAGARLKRLRRERQLTQAAMAADLDVSPSYLNLMERNQRPVTVQILIRLTDVYGVDPREFMAAEGEHSAGELEQMLTDPLFRDAPVPRAEVRDAAESSPALLAAMARLYRAYAAAREAAEAGFFSGHGADRTAPVVGESPVDRVRAILQESHNHFPELEEAGESLAAELALAGADLFHPLSDYLRARHNVRVRILPIEPMAGRLRWYDRHRRQLMISEAVAPPGRTFQLAYQLALSQYPDLLNEVSARLEPHHDLTRRLLRVTLANYFAGALMMPYGRFLEAAEASGYDIAILGARFCASFEQVAHRLTTLARPAARGVPFFLIRVDMAGNVSKRFSPSRFPFAHSGGTCPLWNIHAAFAEPGKILTQIIELPDGTQWFSLCRTARRARAPYGAIEPCFAIGLGCELKYAKRLVYARRLDFDALEATPIGINCRLCDRPLCPQRAAPPAMRQLFVDETTRSISPFTFKDV